jgi:hypothetical protein
MNKNEHTTNAMRSAFRNIARQQNRLPQTKKS